MKNLNKIINNWCWKLMNRINRLRRLRIILRLKRKFKQNSSVISKMNLLPCKKITPNCSKKIKNISKRINKKLIKWNKTNANCKQNNKNLSLQLKAPKK